jgi:hypothetical protein
MACDEVGEQIALLLLVDPDGRYCVTSSAVALRRATSTSAGLLQHGRGPVRGLSAAKVAENSRFWRTLGQHLDDAADVADEAHVEHAVGFVEHRGSRTLGEVDGALPMVVEQASGRGDEDVDAATQALDLGLMPTPPKITARARRPVWAP